MTLLRESMQEAGVIGIARVVMHTKDSLIGKAKEAQRFTALVANARLGEMRELGPESITEHDALGRLAASLNVSRLVAVGQRTQPIDKGARHAGSPGHESIWVPDTDAAYELLREHLAPGDVVLLKSSHDAGLRWLGDRLLDTPGSEVLS